MTPIPRPSPDDRPDGFILVAVLWILGALATLAAIYALYVRSAAPAFAAYDDRIQIEGLTRAGVELAVGQLTGTPNARPVRGRITFRLGKGQVAVDYSSEATRIDLNFAPREVLAGLFTVFGVTRQDADGFAERILAWRTPSESAAASSEVSLYRSAGRSYGPRHGPFQHVNELAFVVGIPAHLIDRALPFLTVYSGRAEVNVLNAPSEVVAALPGVTPESLSLLMLAQGDNIPMDILRARLGNAAPYTTLQASNANRISVNVLYDEKRRVRSEVVVLLVDGDSEPYRVLSWRNDIGEASSDGRSNASMR